MILANIIACFLVVLYLIILLVQIGARDQAEYEKWVEEQFKKLDDEHNQTYHGE
jgi:hypothetical protein